MGDHLNRTWCHVIPNVAHILLIFLTHGIQSVSQKIFSQIFLMHGTQPISQKNFSQNFIMYRTQPKKFLTKISHKNCSRMEQNL